MIKFQDDTQACVFLDSWHNSLMLLESSDLTSLSLFLAAECPRLCLTLAFLDSLDQFNLLNW